MNAGPPFELSRADFADKPYIRWNAFLNLAFQPLAGLTENQRHASIALSYLCEGGNNGNLGVFYYLSHVQPSLLINALHAIGDKTNVCSVQRIVSVIGPSLPEDAVERDDYVMERWTEELDECEYVDDIALQYSLEKFLDRHETDFIRWID